MPKKKKPSRKKKLTPSLESVEILVNKSDYRAAIKMLKGLYEQEPSDRHQQELLSLLRRRGADLAAKGLYQEATVIWQQQLSYVAEQHVIDACYLDWLLRAGKKKQAVGLWQQLTTEQVRSGNMRSISE